MLDTSTSPGPASEATRAPMCTAIPRDLVAAELALAGVQARAHVEAERATHVRDRPRAADRARRPVEGGEEPVAGRVDLAPAEALELATHERVVALEQLAPAAVAELARARSVEPTMSVNRTVASTRSGSARLAHAGEELLDLVEHVVRRSPSSDVVVAGQLDERAPGMVRARKRAFSTRQTLSPARCSTSVGRLIAGDDVADVDLERHPHERERRRAARRLHLERSDQLVQLRVAVYGWARRVGRRALTPA